MSKIEIFETVSFHIVKPCNMKCKFCYATFEDQHGIRQISLSDATIVVTKLHEAGVKKITFAGGEPMLYRHINEIIKYAKSIGMTTSIITNGSLITADWLAEMAGHLDWIGVSIDSLDSSINNLIGRQQSKKHMDYRALVKQIRLFGFRLKINTVVNRYNRLEDLNEFIEYAKPERWKVFQALKVDGQNDKQFDEIRVSDAEFNEFIDRHYANRCLVPENNESMIASYLLIDPQGRLFENSKGAHTYSEPLQDNDINKCLSQISLDREMFIKRGGIYNW